MSCFVRVYFQQLDQVWADWEVDIMMLQKLENLIVFLFQHCVESPFKLFHRLVQVNQQVENSVVFFIFALFEKRHDSIHYYLAVDSLIWKSSYQLQQALKVFYFNKVEAKLCVKANLQHNWESFVYTRASLIFSITLQVLSVRHLLDKVFQLTVLHHLIQPELPAISIASSIALKFDQKVLDLLQFVSLQHQRADIACLDLVKQISVGFWAGSESLFVALLDVELVSDLCCSYSFDLDDSLRVVKVQSLRVSWVTYERIVVLLVLALEKFNLLTEQVCAFTTLLVLRLLPSRHCCCLCLS